MLIETERTPRVHFSARELGRAAYDERGIHVEGRHVELEALRAMGARDPSLGRLYEGHFNGALLVALYGTSEQTRRARRDAAAGHLFGVWNTEDESGLTIASLGDGTHALRGSKTWASGADTVTRALVTARRDDGMLQMCVVPLDRYERAIDDTAWKPLGMEASNSFRISFDGISLGDDDLIGSPNDYERSPWFFGGALRFVAVHVGIIERLADETLAYFHARGRGDDPMQRARAGEIRIAVQSARNWIRAGEDAWTAYDDDPTPDRAARIVDVVDMARLAVERAGLDVIERAVRGVGARGLLAPLPFAALVRDLEMYLRQPAPDATLLRVGSNGMRSASARLSDTIAD